MKKTLTLLSLAVCMSLSLTACPPPPENTGPEPGTKEYILKEIEDNWHDLGYSQMPAKYVALTFDDGPAGDTTQDLLDILADKKVKATFFLIGQNIRAKKAVAQAIFDAGHEPANHSDGYASLGGAELNSIKTSLTAASDALFEITGTMPTLFRAPNVNYGNNLSAACTELGLAIIGVNIWSNDYSGINADAIKNNVLTSSSLSDGGIINLHEPNTAPNTVAALPGIIDGLREKGFWIMTVGELSIIKDIPLQAGTRYDSIK